MNDPDYHPHYPDRANDYFLRLMNNAQRFADYRRLAFFDYVNWEIVDGYARLKATCEFCGGTEGVEYIPDPYDSDIHGDDTPHWICADCYQKHCEDI